MFKVQGQGLMTDDQNKNQGDTAIPPARGLNGTAQLLHLADYGSVQPARIIAELRGYWESLRQGRAIPARADVEPRGIRRALDYSFVLERIAPGAARFRLAGRHLIDLMGMEVRGMPFCSFMNTSSRGRLSDVLECVFRGPQIAEIRLESLASYGRPGLDGRMLLLPLRSDLGDVTRALGCLIAEGEIGQGPRRFDLMEDLHFPVIPGAKLLEPSPSAVGFAETPAPWKPRNPQNRDETSAAETGPEAARDTTPEDRRARFRIVSQRDDPVPPLSRM
jgi:hypothetical protein